MWVILELYMIFVITKLADTNKVNFLGDLQNDNNESYRNKVNIKKFKFVDLIVKPSESFIMIPKTEKFEIPSWKSKISHNIDIFKISPTKFKKSLVSVGIHHGPSYHMELHSNSPSTDLSHCSNCNQHNISMILDIITRKLYRSSNEDDLILQERRNPTFSPWGGKRNTIPFKLDTKIRRPVRVPFNSWGGKRQENFFNSNKRREMIEKKLDNASGIKKPFNSWGGKRTPFTLQSIYSHDKFVNDYI